MGLISASNAHCLSKSSKQERTREATEKISKEIEVACYEGQFACECFFVRTPSEIATIENEILPNLIANGYKVVFSRAEKTCSIAIKW